MKRKPSYPIVPSPNNTFNSDPKPMSHQRLFPGYLTDAEDQQLLDAGLHDWSWGNDAMPMWGATEQGVAPDYPLVLSTDHPEDSQRECPGGKRFCVFVLNGYDHQLFCETDDLTEAIKKFNEVDTNYDTPKTMNKHSNNIETKFKLGDKVWTMASNRPVELTIEAITIRVHRTGILVQYSGSIISDDADNVTRCEAEVFVSKAALLASF